MKSAPPKSLSFKQVHQLMTTVMDVHARGTKFNNIDDCIAIMAERCDFVPSAANIKTACKNAEIPFSSIVGGHTSPLATLHIRVTDALRRLEIAEKKIEDLERRCPRAPHTNV